MYEKQHRTASGIFRKLFPDKGGMSAGKKDLPPALMTAWRDLMRHKPGKVRLRMIESTLFEFNRISIKTEECIVEAGSVEGMRRGLYRLGGLLKNGRPLGTSTMHSVIRDRIGRSFMAPINRPPLYHDELMDDFRPDVVHLNNVHTQLSPVMAELAHRRGVRVVWTLHDCWPFTGHCAHFDFAGCDRWQVGCHHCPQRGAYPASWLADRSRRNWEAKRRAFTSLGRLTLVPVSDWLGGLLGRSFLAGYPVHRIYNGVDTSVFCPQPSASAEAWRERLGIGHRHVLLGVASVWGSRKGLADFVALRRALPAEEYAIVLVGLKPGQAKGLPEGIVAVPRTDNVRQLAELYAAASVFVNPTWEDNFPTTNLEALACGTPVITYRTGGSVEAVDDATGCVVPQGDIPALASAVRSLCGRGKEAWTDACRRRALERYDKNERFREYIDLYEGLMNA